MTVTTELPRQRTHRGTSNTNDRGSAAARRARKQWLLDTYGDGELTVCWRCDVPLLREDLEVDRVTPGCRGGRYIRANIRPVCGPCNKDWGNAVRDGITL